METRRVRVLRVIARLNVGGPALHATLLTERLDPARYDTRLVTGSVGAGEGDYLALRGVAPDGVIHLPSLGRAIHPVRDLAVLRQLVGVIRAFGPDIVHTHTAKAGALGRLAAWMCGVPRLVHTYHGHVFEGYFSPMTTRAFVTAERWLARRTDVLVTVTDRVRRDILALGIGRPGQVEVVPLGLDLGRFAAAGRRRGELRRELGLPDAAPLVGIVARLVPIKAHDVFLAAAAAVLARRPDAWFLVAGDGETRGALEARARELGIAPRVRFLGWRADLERLYADLDVVVLTSRNEGSPVALIEAMAAGRPVVSTRAGGVVDVVTDGETGLLAAVDDADGVARAILGVLANPDLGARLGEAGRARVTAAFASERLLADLDRLYSRLLAAS